MKCDIIAAGESLRGFDFDQLTSFRIVLNNIYKYIPYDINVWFDNVNKLLPKDELNKIHNLETLTCYGGRWIKTNNRDIVRGSNEVSTCNSTLILAVNIAINLGYKEIDIYGADFGAVKYGHFYDQTPTPKTILERQNRNLKSIRSMWDNLTFLDDEIIKIKKPDHKPS